MEMRCEFCNWVGDVNPGILHCPHCGEQETLYAIEQFDPDFNQDVQDEPNTHECPDTADVDTPPDEPE